jgi:hypothetical protein
MQVLGTTTKCAEAGAPDIPVVVTSRRLMTADIVRLTLGDPQDRKAEVIADCRSALDEQPLHASVENLSPLVAEPLTCLESDQYASAQALAVLRLRLRHNAPSLREDTPVQENHRNH